MRTHAGGVRVVLMEPEYQQNIGYCCRVMKNFGFSELYMVNPACKLGQEAIKYSKHAADLLQNARICGDLAEATKDCGAVVGTTAIRKLGRDLTRESITPGELAMKLKGSKAQVALLIGREGTGLSREELQGCDIVVRIEGNLDYPTLNISHALAILLYELSRDRFKPTVEAMDENEKRMLLKYFNSFVDSHRQGIRCPATIKLAFKRVLGRGIRSRVEARALLQMLKKI